MGALSGSQRCHFGPFLSLCARESSVIDCSERGLAVRFVRMSMCVCTYVCVCVFNSELSMCCIS